MLAYEVLSRISTCLDLLMILFLMQSTTLFAFFMPYYTTSSCWVCCPPGPTSSKSQALQQTYTPVCSLSVLPLKFIPFQMQFLFIFVKTLTILVGPIFQPPKVSLNEWWLLLPRHLPLLPLWSHLQIQGWFSPIIRIFTKILNSTTTPSINFQGTAFQGLLTVRLWATNTTLSFDF